MVALPFRLTFKQPCNNSSSLILLELLRGREISLIIDDTGNRKKGNKTAYVKRQYIRNLGKVENGIVAAAAYGLVAGMMLPLIFEVYKHKERLLEDNIYHSKSEITTMINYRLRASGFKFKLVLAGSLYGESCRHFVPCSRSILSQFCCSNS